MGEPEGTDGVDGTAARPSDAEPGPETEPGREQGPAGSPASEPPGSLSTTPWNRLPELLRWSGHSAEIARATAIDLAVLAGHLLLYPTGMFPERSPGPPRESPENPEGHASGDGPAGHKTAEAAEPAEDGSGSTPDSGDSGPDSGPDADAAPSAGSGPAPRPRTRSRTTARTTPRADRSEPSHPNAPAPGATPGPHRPEAEAHPPVLMIHGFVDNRSAFTLLRRSLRHHGWTRVQALNYSPLTGDIRTAAAMLGPHIEKVCAECGQERVDIVGHSLGGLVARYYVQCLGGDARVRTLVTLGTPHAGTRAVPALAPHPLARQMRPGSPVLEELAGPAPGCRTCFVAFWSDLDELMIPVGSARLEHPDLRVRNVKVGGIGHLAMPVHTSVAAEVRRALAGPGALPDTIDAA